MTAIIGIPSWGGPVRVGSYKPNGYGLFDMLGNVVERVQDHYDCDYYASPPVRNPKGPDKGKFRVIRGGGWHPGPATVFILEMRFQ